MLLLSAVGVRAMTLDSAEISDPARARARAFLRGKPARQVACVAATNSMRPVFDAEYLVVLEPRPYDELERNDIVVFSAQWAPTQVVHRLLCRTRGGWLTKGDNAVRVDPTLLTKENYRGAIAIAAIHKRTGRVVAL